MSSMLSNSRLVMIKLQSGKLVQYLLSKTHIIILSYLLINSLHSSYIIQTQNVLQ